MADIAARHDHRWHAFDDESARATGRHRKYRQHTRRWAVVGSVAIGVAALAGTTLWITATPETRGIESSASAAAVDADAAEWMHFNFPGDVKILTDGHGAPAGYQHSPIDRPGQDWHDFDFLLTAPGSDPPLDASVATVWQSSVPVAIFPTVQVRRILRTSLTETLKTAEADRADRLVAGTALVSNPRVVASPHAQERLIAGGLDLRAAATLTAIAGSMAVNVADIEDVKAEALAGMPARAMTIHVADAVAGNLVISGMTEAFRPDQVIATPDGTYRLHWPLRLAPLPSVN